MGLVSGQRSGFLPPWNHQIQAELLAPNRVISIPYLGGNLDRFGP